MVPSTTPAAPLGMTGGEELHLLKIIISKFSLPVYEIPPLATLGQDDRGRRCSARITVKEDRFSRIFFLFAVNGKAIGKSYWYYIYDKQNWLTNQ